MNKVDKIVKPSNLRLAAGNGVCLVRVTSTKVVATQSFEFYSVCPDEQDILDRLHQSFKADSVEYTVKRGQYGMGFDVLVIGELEVPPAKLAKLYAAVQNMDWARNYKEEAYIEFLRRSKEEDKAHAAAYKAAKQLDL